MQAFIFLRKLAAGQLTPSGDDGHRLASLSTATPSVKCAKGHIVHQVDQWDKFRQCINKLHSIEKESLSEQQIAALATGASNLLQIAQSGTAQPRLYELRRSRGKLSLSKRKRASYERTRAPVPVRKQQRGKYNRVKEHKRKHKQTRLTKDAGFSTVLVGTCSLVHFSLSHFLHLLCV